MTHLTPGPDLDEMIARELGWTDFTKYPSHNGGILIIGRPPKGEFRIDVPAWSTNDADAVALLEKANRRGWSYTVVHLPGRKVKCQIDANPSKPDYANLFDAYDGDTIAHAVSMAFLVACAAQRKDAPA